MLTALNFIFENRLHYNHILCHHHPTVRIVNARLLRNFTLTFIHNIQRLIKFRAKRKLNPSFIPLKLIKIRHYQQPAKLIRKCQTRNQNEEEGEEEDESMKRKVLQQ